MAINAGPRPRRLEIDPAKLEMFGDVGKLLQKYRPGRVGMVHVLDDGTWAVNQSGFEVEPLGKTLPEIEAYLQAHPQAGGCEAQIGEFSKRWLATTGIDLSGDQPVIRPPAAAPPAPSPAPTRQVMTDAHDPWDFE